MKKVERHKKIDYSNIWHLYFFFFSNILFLTFLIKKLEKVCQKKSQKKYRCPIFCIFQVFVLIHRSVQTCSRLISRHLESRITCNSRHLEAHLESRNHFETISRQPYPPKLAELYPKITRGNFANSRFGEIALIPENFVLA